VKCAKRKMAFKSCIQPREAIGNSNIHRVFTTRLKRDTIEEGTVREGLVRQNSDGTLLGKKGG